MRAATAPARRHDELQSVVLEFVTKYEDRILPLDRQESEAAAELRVHTQRSDRVLHPGEALIARIAKAHDLAVATRNVADFGGLDLDVTNPWEQPPQGSGSIEHAEELESVPAATQRKRLTGDTSYPSPSSSLMDSPQ